MNTKRHPPSRNFEKGGVKKEPVDSTDDDDTGADQTEQGDQVKEPDAKPITDQNSKPVNQDQMKPVDPVSSRQGINEYLVNPTGPVKEEKKLQWSSFQDAFLNHAANQPVLKKNAPVRMGNVKPKIINRSSGSQQQSVGGNSSSSGTSDSSSSSTDSSSEGKSSCSSTDSYNGGKSGSSPAEDMPMLTMEGNACMLPLDKNMPQLTMQGTQQQASMDSMILNLSSKAPKAVDSKVGINVSAALEQSYPKPPVLSPAAPNATGYDPTRINIDGKLQQALSGHHSQFMHDISSFNALPAPPPKNSEPMMNSAYSNVMFDSGSVMEVAQDLSLSAAVGRRPSGGNMVNDRNPHFTKPQNNTSSQQAQVHPANTGLMPNVLRTIAPGAQQQPQLLMAGISPIHPSFFNPSVLKQIPMNLTRYSAPALHQGGMKNNSSTMGIGKKRKKEPPPHVHVPSSTPRHLKQVKNVNPSYTQSLLRAPLTQQQVLPVSINNITTPQQMPFVNTMPAVTNNGRNNEAVPQDAVTSDNSQSTSSNQNMGNLSGQVQSAYSTGGSNVGQAISGMHTYAQSPQSSIAQQQQQDMPLFHSLMKPTCLAPVTTIPHSLSTQSTALNQISSGCPAQSTYTISSPPAVTLVTGLAGPSSAHNTVTAQSLLPSQPISTLCQQQQQNALVTQQATSKPQPSPINLQLLQQLASANKMGQPSLMKSPSGQLVLVSANPGLTQASIGAGQGTASKVISLSSNKQPAKFEQVVNQQPQIQVQDQATSESEQPKNLVGVATIPLSRVQAQPLQLVQGLHTALSGVAQPTLQLRLQVPLVPTLAAGQLGIRQNLVPTTTTNSSMPSGTTHPVSRASLLTMSASHTSARTNPPSARTVAQILSAPASGMSLIKVPPSSQPSTQAKVKSETSAPAMTTITIPYTMPPSVVTTLSPNTMFIAPVSMANPSTTPRILPAIAEELDNPLSVPAVRATSSVTSTKVSQAMRYGIKTEPLLSNLAPANHQLPHRLCGTSSDNLSPTLTLCEAKLETDSDVDLGLASDVSLKSEETIKAEDPEDLFLPIDMDYTETLPYSIEADTISLEHSYQQNLSDSDIPLKDINPKRTTPKSAGSDTGKKKVGF